MLSFSVRVFIRSTLSSRRFGANSERLPHRVARRPGRDGDSRDADLGRAHGGPWGAYGGERETLPTEKIGGRALENAQTIGADSARDGWAAAELSSGIAGLRRAAFAPRIYAREEMIAV